MKKRFALLFAATIFCLCSILPSYAQTTTVTPQQDSAITSTINDISTYGQQADQVLDQLHLDWGKAETFHDSLNSFVKTLPADSSVKTFAVRMVDIANQVDEHNKTGKKWTSTEIWSLAGGIFTALCILIGILVGRFLPRKPKQ